MHRRQRVQEHSRARNIVLVGNPNVGKSVIFSHLTGRYAIVSNYPGTTVEVSRGRSHADPQTVVIDTPGVNSLHPQSVDERVTRDIIFSSPVDVVIQVADAKNLRRGLTITTQLAEMGLPVVLVLNMMDEAARRGIRISTETLAEAIQVPVIGTVAVEKKGFKKLDSHIGGTAPVPAITVEYPAEIEHAIAEISRLLPECPIAKRALALMFLSDPAEARESLESLMGRGKAAAAADIAEALQNQLSNPLSYIIGVSRSRTVDRLLDAVYLKDISALGPAARRTVRRKQLYGTLIVTLFSLLMYSLCGVENLAKWGLHPTFLHVIVIMLLLIALPPRTLERMTTHWLLGTVFLVEILYLMLKFVGLFGAGTLVDLIETKLFGGVILPFVQSGVDRIAPGGFINDLLMGQYGLISMGLTYSIAIVLPIVATFFFAFGILEDSGYLPRLSVIADRTMRKIGLNGKAVLPMVLGLGCVTMATLTTRILDSKKERVIATLLLALGVPCSAQLGVVLAIVSQCSLPVMATVVGVVLMQLFIVGALAARVIPGRGGDFIVELPPLRPPLMLNIITKTVHRLRWFLIEAVPLFLAGTFLLFVIERAGGIAVLEKTARPVVGGMLGLPVDSTYAFIIGFFRRDYGAAGLYDLFRNGMLNHNQVAVSMVVITLFVPCIANFFVMVKERGVRTALAMVAFILPYAIMIGAGLNAFFTFTGIVL